MDPNPFTHFRWLRPRLGNTDQMHLVGLTRSQPQRSYAFRFTGDAANPVHGSRVMADGTYSAGYPEETGEPDGGVGRVQRKREHLSIDEGRIQQQVEGETQLRHTFRIAACQSQARAPRSEHRTSPGF